MHLLPDAPRPDPETSAPPRFLPEFDNVLLSHADRSRVIVDGRLPPLFPGNGGVMGTLLVDGVFQATWRIARQGDGAKLIVAPFTQLSVCVHSLPSLQSEPLGFAGFEQRPVPGLHVPATWH